MPLFQSGGILRQGSPDLLNPSLHHSIDGLALQSLQILHHDGICEYTSMNVMQPTDYKCRCLTAHERGFVVQPPPIHRHRHGLMEDSYHYISGGPFVIVATAFR